MNGFARPSFLVSDQKMLARTRDLFLPDTYQEYSVKNFDSLTIDDICNKNPGEFRLQNQQALYRQYIRPDKPGRVLLDNAVGTGKTCSATTISEQFIEAGMLVFVAMPLSLLPNFVSELKTGCSKYRYSFERVTMNGKKMDNVFIGKPTDIVFSLDPSVKKNSPGHYIITSHAMMPKVFDMLDPGEPCLMVIDEVHKVVSLTGVTYKKYINLTRVLLHPKSSIVLLSGTPIVDKVVEFALVMNLILPAKYLFDVDHFNRLYIDGRVLNGKVVYSPKHDEDFMYRIKDHVGFFQGYGKIAFPEVINQFVDCPMSKYQSDVYSAVHLQNFGLVKKLNVLTFKPKNNFYMRTRTLSNVVPPEGNPEDVTINYASISEIKELSCKGYELLMLLKSRIIFPCFIFSYFLGSGVFMIGDILAHQGYVEVFWDETNVAFRNAETNGESGFEYLNPDEFTDVHGFETDDTDYDKEDIDDYFSTTETISEREYEEIVERIMRIEKPLFAVVSSKTPRKFRILIVRLYIDARNHNGKLVSMIVGSSVLQVGLSLLRTRSVVMFDPAWNYPTMKQIIARAIRFCGHYLLPPKERNVTVYFLRSYIPKKYMEEEFTPVDFLMYDYAAAKRDLANEFTLLIWRSSFDCKTFKNVNASAMEYELTEASNDPKESAKIIGKQNCYYPPLVAPKLVKYKPNSGPTRNTTIAFAEGSTSMNLTQFRKVVQYIEAAIVEGKLFPEEITIVGYSTDKERRKPRTQRIYFRRAHIIQEAIYDELGLVIPISQDQGLDSFGNVADRSMVKLEFDKEI